MNLLKSLIIGGFSNGLLSSHRDFDLFYSRLLKGQKSAIVSGLNPSGFFHIGHIGVFDTNLFFQKEYGIDVYAPISDDESYVSDKIKSQEEGIRNGLKLAREYLAYGFNPKKTHIIIDQIYTNIYNLAIKLAKSITLSTNMAVYGYTHSDNIGLNFYPAVQTAHVVLPETFGMRNVLVPIGPDEDTHLRIARDVVEKYGYEKPSVLHSRFFPGLDGRKMSKSKGNAVYLFEDEAVMKKKVYSAFSGGRSSIEEHRLLGGVPEIDVAYIYLKYFFLESEEAEALGREYKSGRLLSGELKKMLYDKVIEQTAKIKENYKKIGRRELSQAIMRNDDVDLEGLIDKYGVLSE
ncbi:MAG: tryptophan--tRNA ligase [Candidatus Marsarchaeota archaeon]|nr:tryptophan--tRNA ligase [Candidatus Marsarchaeota archaeon]